MVGADGVDGARVGRAHGARVRARLEDVLGHALGLLDLVRVRVRVRVRLWVRVRVRARARVRLSGLLDLPLVDGAVHARRDEARVVLRPVDGLDLAVVAAQVVDVLARVRGVDLDRVAVDGGEALPADGEAALAARLDRELLVRAEG